MILADEQFWKIDYIESGLHQMGISMPTEIAEAIACLDRDALHQLIQLLNLAVWLDSYQKWDAFSASIVWSTVNKFLESQTDSKVWLALLKVLVGVL